MGDFCFHFTGQDQEPVDDVCVFKTTVHLSSQHTPSVMLQQHVGQPHGEECAAGCPETARWASPLAHSNHPDRLPLMEALGV